MPELEGMPELERKLVDAIIGGGCHKWISSCLSIYKGKVDSVELSEIPVASLRRIYPIEWAASEHALRSKSEKPTVYQKEIKPREKGRPAGTTVSSGPCTDHPQGWQILHISVNRS